MNIAASASSAEVAIFFTFEALSIIHKEAANMLTIGAGKEYYLKGFKRANVPSIPDLVNIALESGVKLITCQITMDEAGMTKEHFVNRIDVGGAMTFLDFADDADVTVTF